MTSLGDKQRKFFFMVADLIIMIRSYGFEATFGEALRSDEQALINSLGNDGRKRLATYLEQIEEFKELGSALRNNVGNGVKNSLHQFKLAIDINLFKDGLYLSAPEYYEPLGRYWESIGGTWGGRFGDADHFSLEHNGVK